MSAALIACVALAMRVQAATQLARALGLQRRFATADADPERLARLAKLAGAGIVE